MRRLLIPLVLSLATLAAFTACTSRVPVSGLSVELLKLERASDGSVMATVQVDNATVIAFNIANSKHQLILNGKPAGTLEIKEPLGLPAQRNMPQTGRLVLTGGELPSGNATYQLNSELALVLSGDKHEIQKFSTSGTVQVP
jgi:hypothetical protein